VSGTIRPQTEGDVSVKELKEITKDVFMLDYTDETSIIKAAEDFGNRPLDVLVNCAGVEPQPVTWKEHSGEKLMERFQIMVVGPFLASKHFLPALQKSEGKIINISSDMASISDNDYGTNLAYRLAKAGVNQLTVTIAKECEKDGTTVTVNAIHPGWTPTNVSHFTGPDDIQQLASELVETVEGLDGKSNGRFMTRKGVDMAF